MRKNIFYFVIISLFFLVIKLDFLSSQEWVTSNVINGTRIEPKKSAFDKSDNSIYTFSNFSDTVFLAESIIAKGSNDILISKFDPDGSNPWNYHIASNESFIYSGISLRNDGSILIAASFTDTCWFEDNSYLVSTGNYDIFVIQLDQNGGLVWAKSVGISSPDQYVMDIRTDLNNEILLAGIFKDTVVLDTDNDQETIISPQSNFLTAFIVKFDENAESIIWTKQISSSSQSSNIRRINFSSDGYYFGGVFRGSLTLGSSTYNSTSGSLDAFLFKSDLDGSISWSRQISGGSNEFLLNIRADEFDNIYVVGNYMSSSLRIDSTDTEESVIPLNKGGYDTYICKYNRTGVLQWSLTKGGTETDVYNDFSIRNNFMYSTGLFAEEIVFNNDTLTTDVPENPDAFLASFNSIGDPISGVSIKGTGNYDDKGVSIYSDVNNNAFIIGYFRSPEIEIGEDIFNNSHPGNSNLFYAQFTHPYGAAFTNESNISCQGYSDGMLTVTPYFGAPPYTYSWTKDGSPFAETDSVAEGLDAGLYRVNITDNRDSIAIVEVQLNNPAPISIGYVTDEVSCYNGNDGGIDITATGGNNNYVYNWSGGSGLSPTSEDQTGLIAADYTVTVTDIKGCTASQTIILGQADPITFDESIIISTNADVDTGRVDLNLNGGTEPYETFLWEGPDGFTSIEDSIDGLNGGNYSVTVTDANSCIADTTFLVPNDSLFIAYMTDINDVTCGDLTDGSAFVSSNRHGMHNSFEYVWIDLEDSVQVGGNFNYVNNLDSSEYRVYLIDLINEDTTFVEFDIYKPTLLTVNSGAANPLCFGSSDGFVNAIVSGGTLPYSYDWSNGATDEDLSNIQAGTYTLTVTDGNNCEATTEEVLENPEAINITFDFTDPLCPGTLTGTATANVTGGGLLYDYAWNDPGNQTEEAATGLGAGTYTITVTDQNGCLETDAVTLTDPLPVGVTSVDSEDASCFGISDGWMKVTAEGGSGSYTYNWSHIGFGADSVGNVGAGTYNVTVTDENDCTPAIETIIINEPAEIIVDIDTVDNICFEETNGQITVTPTGGSGSFDYTWGHTSDNTGVLNDLAAGIYSLTLSDGVCPDLIYDIPIEEPAEIVVSIDTTDISCLNAEDGEIAIATTGGTGSYSYAWSHDVTTEANITVTEPGNYTVTITDGACPEMVYTIPINEPELFEVDIDTVVTNCFNIAGGSITVTPSGGSGDYSYTWSHTADDVNQVTDLTYGSYDVTISDGSCPDITANIFVDQPDPLVFDIDTTDVSCLGYSDGAISVNVSGGSESYTYIWGHTSLEITEIGGLSAGNYDLTISDGACPDSALTIPVSEPEELLVSPDKEDVSCYNANDGSIQVNISGGSENYDITWGHTAEKIASLTNLAAGNYNVTVNDGNCPAESETIEITEPEQLLIAGIDSVDLTTAGARDGEIIIHLAGGTEPYRYSLNSGPIQADSVFSNLDAGKYKIVINDANNCGPLATDSIELLVTVGITNYWEESSINYYPNPVDDKVIIETNDLKTKNINLKVVNSMGTLIMNKDIEIPNVQNVFELRTEFLPQGVYFILIDDIRLKTPLIKK